MSRRRRGKGVPLTVAWAVLAALAVIITVIWLIAHLIIFAGIAVLIGGSFYAGRQHERHQSRKALTPSRPAEPRGSSAPDTRAHPARDQLLAEPRSGVRRLHCN